MRICLWGDGPWAARALERVCEDGHQVAAVVSRRVSSDESLVRAARGLEIPIRRPKRCNAKVFVRRMGEMDVDLHVSVSYDQRLKPAIRDTAKLGFVNLHAGKLPFYRGRSVVNWAIINGEPEIGLTLHFVDDGVDTGDIVAQTTLPIGWTDTYADVMDRVVEAVPDFLSRALMDIEAGRIEPRVQRHLLGSYFPRRRPGDEWLDFNLPSERIYNAVRGLSDPGPGARTTYEGRPLIIWSARYDPTWPKYLAKPGEVVGVEPKEGIRVKTADSTIVFSLVEIEGSEDGRFVPRFGIGTRLGPDPAAAIEQLRRAVVANEEKEL